MAREEKRFELKPVDDEPGQEIAVVRLESEETLLRVKPVRLGVPPEHALPSQRLELPPKDIYESRTHQPGIDALIEMEAVNPNATEQDWGLRATEQRHVPWGWFVLLLLILGAAALWSLSAVKKGEVRVNVHRVASESKIDTEASEELEAAQLIDRIHETTRKFFTATDVEHLAKLSRHSERVKPLMIAHYATKPIPHESVASWLELQPMTLGNRANFWMGTVELAGKQERSLLIEILANGEPRIDWETLVCYQPMPWDDYVKGRPAGRSFDFRVYVCPDNFFSHEFSESAGWYSFQLSARESEETLFGYVKKDSAMAKTILDLIRRNRGQVTSMLLRVSIPEGTLSRRGVVIEKLLCPRWLYLDPPEA